METQLIKENIMTCEEITQELLELENQMNKLDKREEENVERLLPKNPIYYMLGIGFIPLIIVQILNIGLGFDKARLESKQEKLRNLREKQCY